MSEMEAQSTESDFAATFKLCGACKETLRGKEPKLLPCLHTFCHSCFEMNVSDHEMTGDGAFSHGQTLSIVKCPICKMENPISRVLDNLLVGKIKDTPTPEEQAQDAESNKLCTACDEGVSATSFCQECTEWLCDQCVQAHKRVRITKDHTVQPKDAVPQEMAAMAADSNSAAKPMTCPVHKQEMLKLYCETCQKLTCRDCQLLEHKDHRYAFLQDYAQQYKTFLSSLIGKVQEKKQFVENAKSLIDERRSEIEEKKSRIIRDVKLFALKVISEMNQRGKQLVSDLEALCSAKMQILSTKNDEIKSLSSRLDYALKFAQHCAENSTDAELLYTRKVLELEMRNIMRSRCEVPNPHHVLDIKFSYNPTFVLHVGKQGSISVDGIPYPLNPSMIQQAGNRPEMAQFNSEQKQQLIQRMKQLYHQQQQQQQQQQPQQSPHHRPQQQPQSLQQQSVSPTSTLTGPAAGFPGVGGSMHQQHGPLPHQSATVSSSNYHNSRGGPSGGMYPPNTSIGFGNRGPSPPSVNSYQMQLGQANLGKINLFQLQQRLRRQQHHQQQPYFRPGAPHSMQNPIIIEPTDDDASPIHANPVLPANPAGHMAQSPYGSPPAFIDQPATSENSSLSRPVPSATTSPDSARPSCFTSTDAAGKEKSVVDFSFDTDPATLLESIRADAAQLQADTAVEPVSNPQSPAVAGTSASTSSSSDNGAVAKQQKELKEAQMGELIKHLTKAMEDTEQQLKQPNPELLSTTHSSDDPSEDYCAVCHNGGDLLCCESCPKVFHLQCHIPPLPDFPSGEWTCTFCVDDKELYLSAPEPHADFTTGPSGGTKRKSQPGLTARERKISERILLGLFSLGGSTPFHEPVSKTVPNYYKLITNPMDFGTVKMKLSPSHFNHYQGLDEFVLDLMLVFSNCAAYNHQESEIAKAGIRLKLYVRNVLKKFAPFVDIDKLTPEVTLKILPEGQAQGQGQGPGPEPKRRRRDRREGSNTSTVSTVSNVSEAPKEKKDESKTEKAGKTTPVIADEEEEEDTIAEDTIGVEDDPANDSDYVPSQDINIEGTEEEEELPSSEAAEKNKDDDKYKSISDDSDTADSDKDNDDDDDVPMKKKAKQVESDTDENASRDGTPVHFH